MLERLFNHLQGQREAVIRWQREMTARPALGPDNNGLGEHEKAAWLEAELRRLGLQSVRRHDCPDSRVPSAFRPNISARIEGHSSKTLWIIAHMDVVPPGDESLWNGSPWELRVEGDAIYGRGVEDNQQAIASALLAAEALATLSIRPDTSLGLLFVSDEETGMSRGLPYVLDNAPELVGPDDMFLVPDMGSRNGEMVEVAEKSCLGLRFIVTGRPEKGGNSPVAASACVLELEQLYRLFRNKNALFTPPWSTFAPSKREADVDAVSTLAGRDAFFLDCRVLPEYDLDDVEREIKAVARDVAARYAVDIAIETVHREQAPGPTPLDAPVVRRLSGALETHRGLQPRICGAGGQTVAACLRRKGLDAAVWATLLPNPHSPNECSRISATINDAKIMLAMLFDPEGHGQEP